MIVETFPAGPLGCNCSILVDPATKSAIVVDPGGDFEAIRARIEALGATVKAIVHTHTHVDHVGATAPLQALTGAVASIHEADRFLYELLPVQSAMIGVPTVAKADVEGDLVDGRAVVAGAVEIGRAHV